MSILSTYTPATIPRFLRHITEANVPSKVTNTYLRSAGFKSSNDSALIPIFKALGFIDGSSTPTKRWRDYRGDTGIAKALLGTAIKECYSDLFDMYPDAHRKDDEAIANWIRIKSGMGQDSVNRALRTFKTLVSEATFDNAHSQSKSVPIPGASDGNKTPPNFVGAGVTGPPQIKINIELQIPATNNPDVYDHFFAAMKKHLFNES